jgi:hypothetical protein
MLGRASRHTPQSFVDDAGQDHDQVSASARHPRRRGFRHQDRCGLIQNDLFTGEDGTYHRQAGGF